MSDSPGYFSEKEVLGTDAVIMRNVKNKVLEVQYVIGQEKGSRGL